MELKHIFAVSITNNVEQHTDRMSKKMNTKRMFKAICHFKGASVHEIDFSLDELCKSLKSDQCIELYYAIDDIIDDVLDMQFGSSIYFKPNRDCEITKGLLVRTN